MTDLSDEKPSLVSVSQGFSVSYKGKYLYSRYNPERAVKAAAENLSIPSGTLVVVFSPVLWYAIESVFEKLEDSFVVAIENEKPLFDLCKEKLPSPYASRIALFDTKSAKDKIKSLVRSGKIKRAVRLDLSGGTQFHRDEYSDFFARVQDEISIFWKNRITLSRFGRIYARNIMKSLSILPSTLPFADFEKSVEKPIIVFGAGESAEKLLTSLPSPLIKKCYIIAVDAAVLPLEAHGIKIDAIVTVEAQSAIDACFLGINEKSAVLFADVCSRTIRRKVNVGAVCAFCSKYDDARYLEKLSEKNILPTVIDPLGSVGLVAVRLALLLRSQQSIPVFVCGLDFSYSVGATHTKASPAHEARLFRTSRLLPIDNIDAAFASGTEKALDKTGAKTLVTTKNLSGYASLFASYFSQTQFLFDAGESGLPLGIPRVNLGEVSSFLSRVDCAKTVNKPLFSSKQRNDLKKRVTDYYKGEESALLHLKALLMNGESEMSESEKEKESLSETILRFLHERDYLYLHFPDGFSPNAQSQFLKRVRAEIDTFLKDIRLGLNQMILE